jgi:hypothetical protein
MRWVQGTDAYNSWEPTVWSLYDDEGDHYGNVFPAKSHHLDFHRSRIDNESTYVFAYQNHGTKFIETNTPDLEEAKAVLAVLRRMEESNGN